MLDRIANTVDGATFDEARDRFEAAFHGDPNTAPTPLQIDDAAGLFRARLRGLHLAVLGADLGNEDLDALDMMFDVIESDFASFRVLIEAARGAA